MLSKSMSSTTYSTKYYNTQANHDILRLHRLDGIQKFKLKLLVALVVSESEVCEAFVGSQDVHSQPLRK